MKLFNDSLASISRLAMASIIAFWVYAPITNASELDTDDHVVITVKESPAFVNKAGKVVKPSESLESVCLSMKLAILLRTDLGTGDPSVETFPQVTYFPMLNGVRVNHTDVLANQDLTCNVEGTVYTLDEMLYMLPNYFGIKVQVCWDCWISRYGYPEVNTSSNPVYGGMEEGDDLGIFLNAEKKAIQDMFNDADKIIDFD